MRIIVRNLKIVVLSLLLCMQFINAWSQEEEKVGINFRPLTLEQALAEAKKENKPIFLHCYADWCHYCMYMRDSVFTNKEVGEFYNANFINIQLEMQKEGAELNKTLNISTFPSQVFYDANGEIMHRSVGRRMRKMFIELGKEALDTNRQSRTFRKKFESPTASNYDVYYYLRTWEYASNNNQLDVSNYLMKQSDTAFTNAFNWRIIYDFMKDPNYPMMKRVLENKKEFEKKYTTDSVNNKIIDMDVTFLGMYVRRLDSAGYETERKKIMETKGLEIAEKICALSDLNKYNLKSQWDKYNEAAKEAIKKYISNEPARINEIAAICVDHTTDAEGLKTIEGWLIKSIAMKDGYQPNFLLAKAYYKMGEKKKATKAANHAIELGNAEKVNFQPATNLLDDIQKLP